MANDIIYKTTTEVKLFAFDVNDLLDEGDELDSGASTVTAKKSSGSVDNSIVGTVNVIDGEGTNTKLTAILTGGTDGEDYTVTFHGVGDPSAHAHDLVLELRVRNNIIGNV